MPGIVGFTRSLATDAARPGATCLLEKQQSLLCHADSYRQDDLYVDDQIAASRTSVGITNPSDQPVSEGSLKVWMEGEILNHHSMAAGLSLDSLPSDADLLAKLITKDPSFRFLSQLEGLFAAVIYDERAAQLHFINDRNGLEFLYYATPSWGIMWSSEVKGFLAHDDFRRCIDEQSLEHFFRYGHLLGDETWLRDASLLPPASHWVWDLKRHEFTSKQTYWSWDEVTPLPDATDFTAVAEESARLFRDAVSLCDDRPEHRVGVLLSGGLDSRAILVAMEDREDPITTLTFGLPHSSDFQTASKVADLKGAKHIFRPINDENWSTSREDYVWYLDGHLDFLHMHYATCAPQIRDLFDVNLSGYLGDATIGGSYLDASGPPEIERIVQRGRRLIGYGLQQGRIFSHERIPFFNHAFLAHAMRVPARLRKNSHFYFTMLRFLMPAPYQSIPWQSTGLTIRAPASMHSLAKLRSRVTGRVGNLLGLRQNRGGFYDYNQWFASPIGASLIDRLLLSPDARYLALDSFSRRNELRRVCQQTNWTPTELNLVSRGLTLEIWLRQVECGQPRSSGAGNER